MAKTPTKQELLAQIAELQQAAGEQPSTPVQPTAKKSRATCSSSSASPLNKTKSTKKGAAKAAGKSVAKSPTAAKFLKYSKEQIETLMRLRHETHATKFAGSKSNQQRNVAWAKLALDFNLIHFKDFKGLEPLTGPALGNKYCKLVGEYTRRMAALEQTGNPSSTAGDDDDEDEPNGKKRKKEVYDHEKEPEHWDSLVNYLGDKKGLGHVDYGQSETGPVRVFKPLPQSESDFDNDDEDFVLANYDVDASDNEDDSFTGTSASAPVITDSADDCVINASASATTDSPATQDSSSDVANKTRKHRQAETDHTIQKHRQERGLTGAAKGKKGLVNAMNSVGDGIKEGLFSIGQSLVASRAAAAPTTTPGPSTTDAKIDQLAATMRETTAAPTTTPGPSTTDAKIDQLAATMRETTS
ncbi:hypothetical protein HDU98_004113 [Podochytrium sp. JEL0797]|nr:hypothetical protein HDU98_004113 [Podochytrium sp. JEL0797]